MNAKTIRIPGSYPRRRGIAAVLAMLFVVLIASLAVGIYYSEGNSIAIADNEQHIDRASIAAETGLQFARYQVQQINWSTLNIVSTSTSAQVINNVYSALSTNLSGTANMGGHNPSLSVSNVIYIPGETQIGSNYVPNWMSTDPSGGQTYLTISASGSGASTAVTVQSHGQGGGQAGAGIVRAMQVNFAAATIVGPATVFNYGVASDGEIIFNGNMHITGTNNAAMGSVLSMANPAINVNNSNSFSGDFSYTYSGSSSWNYGNLSIDGYLPASSNFSKHVHKGVTATLPTITTSAYQTAIEAASNYQLCTTASAAVGANTATTLSNLELTSGNYTFNKAITINGILFLDSGASVTFNNNCTINGCVVQQNYASSSSEGAVIFDGTMTQTGFPGGAAYAGEVAAIPVCPALLLPNYNVTFNGAVNASGSLVGYGFIFNGVVNVTMNGTLLNMGSSSLIFNSGGNINITNTSTSGTPTGITGGTSYLQFNVSPVSYQEVNP